MGRIEAVAPKGVFQYKLPPSKSHMIRQLMLASKSSGNTEIRFNGSPGEDILSMARCLEKMGVKIGKSTNKWTITPPKNGFIKPKETLFCGNSGTVAKIMTVIGATFDTKITIDGDTSLRKRSNHILANCLRKFDCEVSSDGFPCVIKGPIKVKDIEINASESSQPISALILCSSDFNETMKLTVKGKEVSRGYSQLTTKIARDYGFKNDFEDNKIHLSNWEVVTPKIVNIPGEISLYPMAILLDNLHDGLQVEIEEEDRDNLLFKALETLEDSNITKINLRDASDIITPTAALMAISEGGEISGATHSKGKESDRIIKTSELLKAFSLDCIIQEDGLKLTGGLWPKKPDKPVETHMDHRLAMTAVILATYSGAEIIDLDIIKVTHPSFLKMIETLKSLQP